MTKEISSQIIDNYWNWVNGFQEEKEFNPIESSICSVTKEYFNNKKRTGGILVAAHSCGIIVNFQEMKTDEGLTQIANFIEDTGDFIKYVIYDNGCHLQSHLKNNQFNYPQWMTNINCFIDRFHLKNHKKICEKFSVDKNEATCFANSEICEQLFYTISKFKYAAKHMNKFHFIFFLQQIFHRLNEKRKLK